jgi:hypothetical protein
MKKYVPTLNEFLNEKKYPFVYNNDDAYEESSYHDDTVYATAKVLNKVLFKIKPDFDGKTTWNWNCTTDDENNDMFRVYDWKEENVIGENDKISFHIGADSKESSKIAVDIVDSLLQQYYIPIDKKSIKNAKSAFEKTKKIKRKELFDIWSKIEREYFVNYSNFRAYKRLTWVKASKDNERFDIIQEMIVNTIKYKESNVFDFDLLVYSIMHLMDIQFSIEVQ